MSSVYIYRAMVRKFPLCGSKLRRVFLCVCVYERERENSNSKRFTRIEVYVQSKSCLTTSPC